jgi:hypothetical protein
MNDPIYVEQNGKVFQVRLGEEQALDIGGTTYKLSKYTEELQLKWLTWARRYLPNPLDDLAARLERYPNTPAPIQEKMYADAKAKADQRDGAGDFDVGKLYLEPEGVAKSLALLLARGQTLTDELADDLAGRALAQHGIEHIRGYLTVASGVVPTSENDVERDYFRRLGVDSPIYKPPKTKPHPGRKASIPGGRLGRKGR